MEKTITTNRGLVSNYSVGSAYIKYLSKDRKNHLKAWMEIYQDVRRQWAEAEYCHPRTNAFSSHETSVLQEKTASKTAPVITFLGSFRDCFATAWEDADTYYHIPKSRFSDAEYNQTAYRVAQDGVPGRTKTFLNSLESCVSTAWREADHFCHLPKSSYQDFNSVRPECEVRPQ